MKKNKSVIIIFILILIAFIFLIAFKNSLLKIIYPKKFQEIVAIYQEEYSVEEN